MSRLAIGVATASRQRAEQVGKNVMPKYHQKLIKYRETFRIIVAIPVPHSIAFSIIKCHSMVFEPHDVIKKNVAKGYKMNSFKNYL